MTTDKYTTAYSRESSPFLASLFELKSIQSIEETHPPKRYSRKEGLYVNHSVTVSALPLEDVSI